MAEKDEWMLIKHIMETGKVPSTEFHRGLAEEQEIVRRWMACPATRAKERWKVMEIVAQNRKYEVQSWIDKDTRVRPRDEWWGRLRSATRCKDAEMN
jgi:hypothetical protein